MALLLLLGGAAVFVLGCMLTWQKTRVLLWLTNRACVAASDPGGTASPNELRVEYAYAHDGKQYLSRGVVVLPRESSPHTSTRYAIGESIDVFVNPGNPAEAIIAEQFTQQRVSVTEIIGFVLSTIGGIVSVIGAVVEGKHTIAQIKARSWDV